MQILECWTLVDITHNWMKKSSDSDFRRQERNWEIVVQTLNLRTQINLITSSAILKIDTSNMFGAKYSGNNLVWKFKFSHDFDNLYKYNNDDFFYLKRDFSQIPFTDGLKETVNFDNPVFVTEGIRKNIHFCFTD